MSVEHVEVLVEELSMEAALRILLPRILGDISFEIYPHQCKDELLQRLPSRLRGYASWLPESWRVVVIIDRDDDDCDALKQRMETFAKDTGFITKSSTLHGVYSVVNRLAIEELEAWYFGDWEAVRMVYPRATAAIPRLAKYRNPDTIVGGTWEAFQRVLQQAGYLRSGLRKIEAARAIGEHMEPKRNSSPSFQRLRDVLVEMATA